MQARRSIAGVLIALTIGVALEPLFHSDAGHDPHFAIELHDASQHRFTAPASDESPLHGADHCVVCHLFRHSRSSHSRLVDTDLQPRAMLISGTDEAGRLAAGSAVPLPARAPPARS